MDNTVKSSVQVKDRGNYWQSTIFRLAAQYDIIPAWWSPDRDAFFRGYWYQENFLASAVYAIANRNSAFGWTLTGLPEDVEYAQQMLQFAEFGEGWQSLINKTTIDLLTQDNGAFIEVIRPSRGNKGYGGYDSPLDLPIGLAHLDSGQCQRTGDPDTPVIYTDRNGKKHALKWWQVLMFNEMPSPIEKMNGVGYSALTRLFRSSHIMQSIALYNDEKVSGRFNRAVFLTNVDPDSINDAIRMAENDADNKGLIRYSQPIVASTLDPSASVSLQTINLAEIPDNFNYDTMQNWYIAGLALALGVDYGFLAPLPGKGLGSASQSETMEKQSKGKSSRLFMDMISNALNFKGVLPKSVQFQFTETDTEEDARIEKEKTDRAKRLEIYSKNGWVTPTVAQQMLADYGDIPQVYLNQMGQQDTTPIITTDGDESVETQNAQIEEESEVKSNSVRIAKLSLFRKPTIPEKLIQKARKAFSKKQISIPNTNNTDLEFALSRYADNLEELALQAREGQLSREQFELQLRNTVTDSLIAIYSQMVGTDYADFTEQDEANLAQYLEVNYDSIEKLADDIYGGVYQDTEEKDGVLLLLGRLGLWIINAGALATLGEVYNLANQEERYQFRLGNTQEHCGDCSRLNGQVHTASEWAQHSDMLPGSHSLECKGFNCLCTLQKTDAPVSGGF